MKHDDLVLTAVPTLDPQTQACLNLWAEVFRVGLMDAAEFYKKSLTPPYWITSDNTHPGSFIWLCDLFNMDSDIVRTKWRMNLRKIYRSTKNDAAFTDESRVDVENEVPSNAVATRSSHSTVHSNLRGSKSCR